MIKLVATDIDGTLLQSGEREVPEAVFVQIDRLLKKGILFAAASGRQYSNLKNLFAPKAEEMTFLCENGAILYRKDQILKKRPMPRSRAEALAKQILANDDMEVLISGANTSYLMPKHEDYIYHIQYFLGNRVEIVHSLDEIKEDMIRYQLTAEAARQNMTSRSVIRGEESSQRRLQGKNGWILCCRTKEPGCGIFAVCWGFLRKM